MVLLSTQLRQTEYEHVRLGKFTNFFELEFTKLYFNHVIRVLMRLTSVSSGSIELKFKWIEKLTIFVNLIVFNRKKKR